MLTLVRRLLTPPVFGDEDKTRIAALLNTISLTALALSVVFVVMAPVLSPNPLFSRLAAGAVILPLLGVLRLMRRGHVQLASLAFSLVLWLLITVFAVFAGGVHSASIGVYVFVVLAAGLLLGWPIGSVFLGLSIAAGVGMLYAEGRGFLPTPVMENTSVSIWAAHTTALSAAAALLYLASRSIVTGLERARRNERALAERYRELEAEIAERKRAEKELHESQERYSNLFHHSIDGIFLHDLEGKIVDINQTVLDQFGFTKSEMFSLRISELHPPEALAASQEAFRRIAEDGFVKFEIEFTRRNGDTFLAEVSSSLFEVAGEKIVQGIVRDITERRHAEGELRRLKEFNEGIVQSMTEGIVVQNSDRIFTFVNPAAASLLGYTPEELVGQPWTVIVPQDQRSIVEAADERRMQGQTDRYELELIHKDGARVPVLVSGSPRYDENVGSFAGAMAVFTDITQSKRTEEALRESEARNRALLSAIPDLILQVNSEGVYLDVIPSVDVAPLAAPDELVGMKVSDLLPPEIAQQRMYCVEQALQTGEAQVHEYRLLEKGDYIDYEARIVASGHDRALVIVRDITEQVQAEQEKRWLIDRMQRQQTALIELATHSALAEGRLDEALQAIVQTAADTLDLERVNIWRLSSDRRELRCLEPYDPALQESVGPRVLAVERYPQFFAALEAGWVVDARDVRVDPRTAELTSDCWEPLGISSSLSAPIRLHGQVVGLVCHDCLGPPRSWTSDEVTFASQIADLVAQSFLTADLRRRTEEFAAITRVSREITSTHDLPQVFASIARRAAELSESDASGVFAFRPDGRLYIEAGYGAGDEYIEAVNEQGIMLESGAIGRAVAQRRPIQIRDNRIERGYPYGELAEMEGIRATLAAPMLRGEDVIGGIVLWHRQPRHFSSEEAAFLQALAQQCVNAVENARLFEAEARRRREAETLQSATQALSATLDLQELFELILSELQKVVAYDSASVQQLLGSKLEIIGGHGFPNLEELLGVSFDLAADDNPNGQVIRSRAPVILDDAAAFYEEFRREPHAQAGIRSWLGVPLLFGDQLIGMIALDKKEPGFYNQEHARTALAFAAQAAIAIENARVFTQEEQRAVALARALEKQRELDSLKDKFIQNVSHELRTPLGLIQGYSELLDDGSLGELQSIQREPVAVISRRARMLGKMVENLTAILETETQKSRHEMVDVADLVHKLTTDFQVTARRAGLTLTAEVAPDLPPVFGDPMHLYRVLDNLVGNAVKFTPVGGRIKVCLYQEDECLILEVTDTGVGIPEDQLQRVFERFYQVDGSMSRRYGGAGLGLALVREIVEAHGGHVSVRSTLGEGSAFRVTLPFG